MLSEFFHRIRSALPKGRRVVAGLWLVAFLAASPPALTQPTQTDRPELGTPEVLTYLSGAIWAITLHEVAHALIDILDLTATGPQEDVADEMATMLVLTEALRGVDEAEGIVRASAMTWINNWRFFKLVSDGDQILQDIEYFGHHSLDPQRASNILCLLYGAFPEQHERTVDELFAEELARDPNSDFVRSWRDRCQTEFVRKMRVWDRVFADHASNEVPFERDPDLPEEFQLENLWFGGPVFPPFPPDDRPIFRLDYKIDENPQDRFYEFDFMRNTFEKALAHVSYRLVLPHDIPVSLLNCGTPNAFYYPGTRHIEVCHELLDNMAELFILFTVGSDYETWWDVTRSREVDPRLVGVWRKVNVLGDTGDGWVEVVELGENGAYRSLRYEFAGGQLDLDTERETGAGIWGFAPDELYPNVGTVWALDHRQGLIDIAPVTTELNAHDQTTVFVLAEGFERLE